MRRTSFGFLAALLLLATPTHGFAWDSPAPDVVLYCTPAMDRPLHDVAARYTASNHVAVHLFVNSPDGQFGLILHRARADVVVADTPTIERLGAAHLLRPATSVMLGSDPFVLIGNAAASSSSHLTPEQSIATHPTVLPDATTAASFDGAAVLHASFPNLASSRIAGVADTPTVIVQVASDPALVGIVNRTEARARGVAEIGGLSAAPTIVSGALVGNGQSRNAAALLAFIAGPESRAILQTYGFEVKQ